MFLILGKSEPCVLKKVVLKKKKEKRVTTKQLYPLRAFFRPILLVLKKKREKNLLFRPVPALWTKNRNEKSILICKSHLNTFQKYKNMFDSSLIFLFQA